MNEVIINLFFFFTQIPTLIQFQSLLLPDTTLKCLFTHLQQVFTSFSDPHLLIFIFRSFLFIATMRPKWFKLQIRAKIFQRCSRKSPVVKETSEGSNRGRCPTSIKRDSQISQDSSEDFSREIFFKYFIILFN